MFSVPPADGFVEVGTVDIVGVTGFGSYPYATSLDEFKAQIEKQVCEAGGDAVVANKNGFRSYLQAVVLKSAGGAPTAKASQPVATDGCRYDTQCKGDRICVKGACVDPEKK
jgi:hypothetical protein